ALLRAAYEQLGHDPQGWTLRPGSAGAVLRDFALSRPKSVADVGLAPVRSQGVGRDERGMALPSLADGTLPLPFVDRDRDGLADADGHGHFVDAGGQVLTVPTPFAVPGAPDPVARDVEGRALRTDGQPWYVYESPGDTVLAALTEQVRRLVEEHPEAALSWAPAVQAVLGRTVPQVHTFRDNYPSFFQGFEVNTSPLLDLAQGLAAFLDKDDLPQALELARLLMTQHEGALAGLVHLGWQVHGWLQEEPLASAALEDHSNLLDDLLEVLTDIARTDGLLEDMLASLQDERAKPLGSLLAKQLKYKDRIDFDPTNLNGKVVGDYVTPVDRALGDVPGNLSVLQRQLDLLHDSFGLEVCNRYAPELGPWAECELFRVEDAALFYIEAIAGKARLTLKFPPGDFFAEQFREGSEGKSGMEDFSGLDGFELVERDPADTDPEHEDWVTFRVTPEAAARLLFTPYDERVPMSAGHANLQLTSTEIMVRGEPFHRVHRGTIFAWERDGFFEAMQPLIDVFAKRDQ
ncbi:MAG TPA: hypothetical protein VFH51_07470, partial [Myxococcota bacterium]|nr:hypothetical protein [Myxococcota bacterium]